MCEDGHCPYTWFHFECVGIKHTPRGSSDCKDSSFACCIMWFTLYKCVKQINDYMYTCYSTNSRVTFMLMVVVDYIAQHILSKFYQW